MVFLRLYKDKKSIFGADELAKLSVEEATNIGMPFLFASFPSVKDPEWKNHPGRKNKRSSFVIYHCQPPCRLD